jgi:glyoxylase-like metal-dependent hydrolase (beta-lactamase superfamily II)
MRIVRTFHPVGQGALYSERFYEEDNPQAKYNIVYDCGTSWGAITKAKKVVNLAFDKNDTIDYLFISHLDFDHVSLVNTLIESVDGKVRNIVLPLVYKEEVRIGINLNYIANHQETETFLRWILNSNSSLKIQYMA